MRSLHVMSDDGNAANVESDTRTWSYLQASTRFEISEYHVGSANVSPTYPRPTSQQEYLLSKLGTQDTDAGN